MANEKDGARSVKSQILGDNLNFQIDLRWLIQLIMLVGMVVYGYLTVESRIRSLELNMQLALDEIKQYEQARLQAQQDHEAQMEERILLYEKELNINPFSWGKKAKRK